MKVFVATIRAINWSPAQGRCVEVDTDNLDEEKWNIPEEKAIQLIAKQGKLPSSKGLEDSTLGVGATEEDAKEAAIKVWLEQERDLIDWEDD